MPKPTPKKSKASTPQSGDVYAQRSEDSGRYCAYQITHVVTQSKRESDHSIALLSLDWVGDRLPTPADFSKMRALNNTRYFWGHGIDHRFVNPPIIPPTFQYIGNCAPIVTKETRSFGGWPAPENQAAEQEADWRSRDPERLRRFEAARSSGREFKIAGQDARDTHTHAGPELLDKIKDLTELDKLPRLLEIEAIGPRADLIPYLRTHDLLYRLKWQSHGQQKLDFRGAPHLHNLVLDATGLEALYLHDTLQTLELTGKVHPHLQIHAYVDGANLHFHAPPEIGSSSWSGTGLVTLSSLRITGITQLDLAVIADRYPNLKTLSMAGKPGTLQNFASISRLTNLRWISLDDLFGFGPDDIPPPEVFPGLQNLWLESIPAEAAVHVKTVYGPLKRQSRLDLDVRKPRGPEWMSENLDNPFRDWDGCEFVTAANARKAADLYRKSLAGIRIQIESRNVSSTLPIFLEEMVRNWALSFNKWDKRTQWIETEERETIYEVLEQLLVDAKRRCADAHIDVEALMDIFGELCEF